MMPVAIEDLSVAVLAGGLGTRLRSVVGALPKVLAPVNGRPYLAYLLEQIERSGAQETILLVGYAADQVRAAFGDCHGAMRLRYSAETEPLGTAGAVRLALPLLRGTTVLLLNGDSYLDLDLTAFLEFHAHYGQKASIALAQVENASRFGKVLLGADDQIVRFAEKEPSAAPGWINGGVYLFDRALIEGIPPGQAVSMERDVFPQLVARGEARGFCTSGRFIDIGVPESYAAAAEFFASK